MVRASISEIQASEWLKSQQLVVSLDVVAAAKAHLGFLSLVHANYKLFEKTVLDRAIERYEHCCLPLLAKSVGFVPPLDCCWIWHCHRLNPVQYVEDCKRIFGKIVDAPPLEMSGSALPHSMDFWASNYPGEPYDLDLHSGEMERRYTERPSIISYDLADAALRQRNFYYQVSEPHYLEESFLAAAAARYKGFLHLMRKYGTSTFLVPTYDIDLIWHTHQLHSVSYYNDLTQIIGKVLEHDDTDSDRGRGGKLDTGFNKTRSVWEENFGKAYEKAGCMYRGEPPSPILGTPVYDPRKLSVLSSDRNAELYFYLTKRNIIQVHVSVRDMQGLRDDRSISLVLSLSKHFKSLKFEHMQQNVSQWNVTCDLKVELSTEGLELVVKQRRYMIFKTVGILLIPWKNVLNSELQSLGGWFPLEDPVSVLVYVSVTPPIVGPYLLRSVRVRDTGDDAATHDSHRHGMWVTRNVFDHANEKRFVIRCRYKRAGTFGLKSIPNTEKVVHIHQGGWKYKGHYNAGSVGGRILGSAWQLGSTSTSCTWSLLNNAVNLTVEKDRRDTHWNWRPQLHLKLKSNHCPIMLVSGRKLEFSVPNAAEQQEAWFVTMIRFTKDAPQGKTTALVNWRSGGMQIDPSEDVLLVLLLSATISMSVSEILGDEIPEWNRKADIADNSKRDHWGAAEGIGVEDGEDGGGEGTGGFLGSIGDNGYCWYDGGSYCGGGGGCGIGGGGGCGGGGAGGSGCGGGGGLGGGCGGGGGAAGCGGGGGGAGCGGGASSS